MKSIVMAIALTMMSASAFATESFATAEELPAGSAVEALFTQEGRPVCPPRHVVAKKYCWKKSSFRFVHCGYFCNSVDVPPNRH